MRRTPAAMSAAPGVVPNAALTAALAVLGVVLSSCRTADVFSELPPATCTQEVTPIAAVQGDEWYSPLQDQPVTVRGVVTWLDTGGAFVQEPASDLSPATSDALRVDDKRLADLMAVGDQVVVTGTVAELGEARDTLTAVTALTGYRVCASGVPLPIYDARLPLDSREKEALEGMNIVMQQSLAVTDAWRAYEGYLRISLHGMLPTPTEVALPGEAARQQDRTNRNRSVHVRLHDSDDQAYAAGTSVMSAAGVLGNEGRGALLMLTEPAVSFTDTAYRYDPPGPGDLRIAGMNLHNYFNGDGAGGGFPAERGARSAGEFAAQRASLVALLEFIRPQLVGVMELENDGFGPASAARDFLGDLERASGMSWDVIEPDDTSVGSDRITVGIFYRPDLLRPVGAARLLFEPPFNDLSRVPVAQWFMHKSSGEALLVVVNHFKSKGSCPEDVADPDADQDDGQGCWNQARLASARRLISWIGDLVNESVSGNVLILGDMNAYRMEDPVRAFVEAGFKDLTAPRTGQFGYSFLYRGQAGTLDYAFASAELAGRVRDARALNVNAAYQRGVNLDIPWLGASDHDPVVVDLRLRQASTSD